MSCILRFAGILLIVTLAFASTAAAGGTKVAKYAGEFIAIGVGGRALGMGGACVGVVNDVTAGYWNPAGLARVNYPQLMLMHDARFGNLVNYDYGSVAIPYGLDVSFGLSVIRLGVDGIPDTRNALYDASTGGVIYDINNPNARLDPDKVETFNAADWAVYLTFSKKRSNDFYYGANLKLIRRDLGGNSATGIGFDVAALYSPIPDLFVGLNLQDITTTLVAWNTGTNELVSPTAKLGAGYAVFLGGGRLMPAVDFDIRFEGRKYASMAHVGPVSLDLHAGLEYDFRNIVAVRVGYNDVKQLTFGAGVHLPKLDIDYSFAKFDGEGQLGNTHRISLMLTLQEEKFKRPEK
jgi:hypothetical protein